MLILILCLKKLLISQKPFYNFLHLNRLHDLSHVNLFWYFFYRLIFWKKGSLVDNLSLSYDYTLVRNSLSLINLNTLLIKDITFNQHVVYVRSVKLFKFAFKNKKLSLIYIVIFCYIFSFNIAYKNKVMLLYPYLILDKTSLFFTFNNFFYFKIYNY